MFKKTRARTRATIDSIKAAFRSLISTIEAQTRAVEANTAEQSLLRERLDTITKHTHFLAHQKKAELERAGHKVA